jgi:hypothetical protein
MKQAIRFNQLPDLVDVHHEVEKLRVSVELRLLALGKDGEAEPESVTPATKRKILKKGKEKDPTNAVVYDRLVELEKYVEEHVSSVVESHPVWKNWASKVRGMSPMLLGKVMGRCDITKLTTLGKMRAHSGLVPGQKRRRGEKLDYDAELKSALWVIVRQLIYAAGVYYDQYKKKKEYYTRRFESQGVKVIPTPKGKDKSEKEGTVHLGHVDNMAKRWLARLVADHLMYEWYKAEGIPLREPWAFEYGDHRTFIPPLMDKGG